MIASKTMDFLNVIVDNGNVFENDKELVFGDDDVIVVPTTTTIFDLLVMIEAFSSKSQARKNWTGPAIIPDGFSEFKIGKLKRHLCIWNPKKMEQLDE